MAKFYTGKDKEIYCFCGNLLGAWDKGDPNLHKLKCKKCNRWLWFVAESGYREAKVVPERRESSGVRFY